MGSAAELVRKAVRKAAAGVADPALAVREVKGRRWVARDRERFETLRQASDHPDEFPMGRRWVIFDERDAEAGYAHGDYFYQDLVVAREIFDHNPRRHVDVGSSVNGFVTHVASFRDLDVIDIRPLTSTIPGVRFLQADLMNPPAELHRCTDSLSCLHALEHFGLGRYGDPLDYDGWRKGLHGLDTMLEPGGTLYLGLPTGEPQRIEFNAHRVFSLPFLRDVLLADHALERLAFVGDDGEFVAHADAFSPQAERSFGASLGCSIWVLRKPT